MGRLKRIAAGGCSILICLLCLSNLNLRKSSNEVHIQGSYTHLPVQLIIGNTSEVDVRKPRYIRNSFRPKDRIAVLHDLCLEPDKDGVKLVVYNSKSNRKENISVKAGKLYPKQTSKWPLEYSTLPLPKGKEYTYTTAAFFITHFLDGNLHHFWQDSIDGLFGVMKALNMLGSSDIPQLFYDMDYWKKQTRTGGHNPARYQDILFALPVKKEHICYKNAKPHSCFYNAVFGFYGKGFTLADKRNHFRKAIGVVCPQSAKKIVTIIDRKTRRIANVKDLQREAINAGYEVNVIIPSDLTVKQQFDVIMCTDIMVGVHGAAMRWMDFLPRKSSVLELIWKHWHSFYAGQASAQHRKATTLKAHKVTLNLPVYFRIVFNTSPEITQKMLNHYYKKGPASENDNHWKWGDGTFHPQQFVSSLKRLMPP